LTAPATNTDRTLNLPDAAGTIQVSGNPISGTTGTFTGLVDISAAGAGQIAFPATQNASANANTLDDYEEGTWTPVVADATTGGNTATGSFSGTYTKIGNLVFVSATLNNINTSGMTGGNALLVRSLPFVSSNGPDVVGSCFLDRITFTGFVAPYVAPNNSVIDFRESISNTLDAALTVSDVNVSGGSDIFLSVTYLAT
jgi:hypothetical protein